MHLNKDKSRRLLLIYGAVTLAILGLPNANAESLIQKLRKKAQQSSRESFLEAYSIAEADIEMTLSLVQELTSIPSPRVQSKYQDLVRGMVEPDEFEKEYFEFLLFREVRHTKTVYGVWRSAFSSEILRNLFLGKHPIFTEPEMIQRQIYESIYLLRELDKAWNELLNVIELCISRYALKDLKHPIWIELIQTDLSGRTKHKNVNANTYSPSQITYAREYLLNMYHLRRLVSNVLDRYVYALKQ